VWQRYRTSDLISQKVLAIGDGYRAKNSELASTGIPFARAGNIDSGFSFDGADLFPEADLAKVGEKVSRPGDVVFTSKGTVGRFAFVRPNTPRFVYSPQLCYWRSLDSKVIDSQYLFYWMKSNEFWLQAERVKGQTDMADYVSLGDQRRMFLTLPPLGEQRAIARILGALDDKIELNRRMNRTLEAMAQAIFRSWFVDFEPVSAKRDGRKPAGMDDATAALFPEHFQETEMGPIPAGWDVSSIGMIANVIDCLHSKKPERSTSGKPLLQLSNIRGDGLLDSSELYLIAETDYDKWVSRMEAREGDCVITNVGRVGAVSQIPPGLKAALGRNMTGIRCKASHPFPTFLIECLLSDAMRDEISQKTDAGTILDALNVKNIPLLRFILPSQAILEAFEKRMRPVRAKMEQNFKNSLTLRSLRDNLLPQLLSGELRVKYAEEMIQ
jgi:type I restriction enzyme S subunit